MISDEIITKLRALNEVVPRPMRLPTEDEVKAIERELGVILPHDFRQYLLKLSDVAFSVFEPVTITIPESHTHLPRVAERAWKVWGVPRTMVPICEDNADLYCVTQDGVVIFWAHDMQAAGGQKWMSVGDWIEKVWIEEGTDLQQGG